VLAKEPEKTREDNSNILSDILEGWHSEMGERQKKADRL